MDYTECCGDGLVLTMGTSYGNPFPPQSFSVPGASGITPWHPHKSVRFSAGLSASVDLADGHVDVAGDDLSVAARGPDLVEGHVWDSALAQAGLAGSAGQGWQTSLTPRMGGVLTSTVSYTAAGEGSGFQDAQQGIDIPAFEYARNLADQYPNWTVTGTRLGNALNGAPQVELPPVPELPNLRLLDNVDATQLENGANTGQEVYDRIIFNNPHIEVGDAAARAQATADLIERFVASARTRLAPGGLVRVNINPQFVNLYPSVSGAIARAGGQFVGRFGDDPYGLYVPFTPLRTSGTRIRVPESEPLGEGLSSYNFP